MIQLDVLDELCVSNTLKIFDSKKIMNYNYHSIQKYFSITKNKNYGFVLTFPCFFGLLILGIEIKIFHKLIDIFG